jgi:hypothetical protein
MFVSPGYRDCTILIIQSEGSRQIFPKTAYMPLQGQTANISYLYETLTDGSPVVHGQGIGANAQTVSTTIHRHFICQFKKPVAVLAILHG